MTEANTAMAPTRRVAIDPISRVEGHGKVTLLIDDNDRVVEARLHIVEFRGFERFIQGRPYWEVPVMVQRLCGICPVSHHLAASKALDVALGIHALTPTAEKCRRLMHYGQILQSHALHFFHLSSPDLLLGFDADPATRNVVGVIAAEPEIAKKGVLLRKFGQEVIRHTAGKRIHGTGAIPGGVNKSLSPDERAALLADAYRMVAWSREAVELIARLHCANPALFDSFGAFESSMLSIVAPDGGMDLYHGALRAKDARGELLFDQIDYQHYGELIEEAVAPWSYMKFPYLRRFGRDASWYKVGPLARVQLCDHIATPLADAARREFLDHGAGKPVHATLAYHWARMIEMLHAAETIKDLLHDDDIIGDDLLVAPRRLAGEEGEGVGVIEAPRGTLIHHYRVGEDDLITQCNLIVSTTHNNTAMNTAIRAVADRYLSGRQLTEGLLNHIEVAVRAFDPCLSCATHALGRMPLIVELANYSRGNTAQWASPLRERRSGDHPPGPLPEEGGDRGSPAGDAGGSMYPGGTSPNYSGGDTAPMPPAATPALIDTLIRHGDGRIDRL